MGSKRRPKLITKVNGIDVRVYATRSDYECLIGDGDIDDPTAEVWVYPKVGTPDAWAHQAVLDSGRKTT
jgi:hypothetical protein